MNYTPFSFVNVSFSICFSIVFWLIFATYLRHALNGDDMNVMLPYVVLFVLM